MGHDLREAAEDPYRPELELPRFRPGLVFPPSDMRRAAQVLDRDQNNVGFSNATLKCLGLSSAWADHLSLDWRPGGAPG